MQTRRLLDFTQGPMGGHIVTRPYRRRGIEDMDVAVPARAENPAEWRRLLNHA
jgi:hypothetical protein